MNKLKISKLNICFYIVTLFVVLIIIQISNIKLIGFMIILFNILLCIVTKKNKFLFILIFIISFINISHAYYGCILNHINTPKWQKIGLLGTEYDLYTSKGILITSVILFTIISLQISKFKNTKKLVRQNSNFITYSLIIILSLLIIFGYFSEVRGRVGYSSVQTPIFEYSSILITILWFFSANHKKSVRIFLIIYTICYGFMFLSIGDRSSVAIILMVVFLLEFFNSFSIFKILILFLCTIFIFNMVGIIRSNNLISIQSVITEVLTRGLYVDTISWSYYASITISALHDYVLEPWKFIFGNILYYITGISTTYSGMTTFAQNFSDDLYNAGGGIYSSYFYGMGGYLGVIVGSIILGIIIVNIFKSKSSYGQIYMILLISLSFRWYLYNISTLFRGIFIITTILLIITKIINKIEKIP